MTAIHQFITLGDRTALAQALLSILALDSQIVQEGSEAWLPQSTLNQAREAADQIGYAAALDILTATGLEANVAGDLAVALATPVATTTLVMIQGQQKPASSTDGFMVLQGTTSLWLIRPEADGEPTGKRALIRMVSPHGVILAVKHLIGLS